MEVLDFGIGKIKKFDLISKINFICFKRLNPAGPYVSVHCCYAVVEAYHSKKFKVDKSMYDKCTNYLSTIEYHVKLLKQKTKTLTHS